MSQTTSHPANEWTQALIPFTATGVVCFLGVALGHAYLERSAEAVTRQDGFFAATASWDGRWYVSIVNEGYHYEPGRRSNVAFFPVFPLLGWLTQRITGLRSDVCLLLVANLFLAGSFVLLLLYTRQRYPRESAATYLLILLALGVYPPGFFLRMTYSESVFLFFAVLTLYALERGWPLWVAAVTVGAATGTRSVGVCLLVPLALHSWRTSASWPRTLSRLWLAPLALWGLLAFMAYQQYEFGDPLAFARVQEAWRVRRAETPASKIVDLLTLEPVWSVFEPGSVCCTFGQVGGAHPLSSLHFVNPFYWTAAVILITAGWWRGWLTSAEGTLGLALLAVPYVLRSHEMCMAGMARFTIVAFPLYLVLGRLLALLWRPVAIVLLVLSALGMGAYAALFAAWYRVY